MIIDAFMFNNEIDLLEIRLHELDPVVDKFLIVESLERHGSSTPKAANVAANWDVIRPFEHKVKYYCLPNLQPPHRGPNDSWPRENFHRNAIRDCLLDISLSKDDLIMVSDCDEIPRASAIQLASFYGPGRESYGSGGLCAFNQDFFYYDVNNYIGSWNGTVIGTVGALLQSSPQEWRNRRDSLTRIINGGWHFSYFGGYDSIMSKLANFAHACEDSSRLVCCRSRDEIINDILSGADIYQRPGEGRKERRSHDDPRLPAYMREHLLGKYRLATEDGLREALRG